LPPASLLDELLPVGEVSLALDGLVAGFALAAVAIPSTGSSLEVIYRLLDPVLRLGTR